ncbi:P-loop containing nucleoside triphosphate hydrolase protein [Penicillium coprophilum]|uniref:P-loop containing nucleoside triphosphate hydrolase protein n=1 Tax=Penicillium coprophilum TaxID=36646 RepID=UPI002397EB5E|nr:P-loop containing nucleoside triphosphate hydrolase protein [Penicillium coprophilum]KAJ5170104.1 P-loop containing nucleoside triphosphate hydrolase protein [Penicillium coprophilum]
MLLLLSISVDVAQTAALYLTTESGCKPSAFNMILSIIKVVLLALELKSKRSIVREQWLNTSLENTESIFLETFCCWTNSALRISDDLLPLPKQLSSSILRRKMKTCWESRSRPEGSHALAVATLRCTLRENLCVVPYMLGAICLRYAQPMLMSELILYVSDSPTGDAAWIEVFKLLSATTFVYIGSAIFNDCRDTAKRRVMIAVKGSLIGILHEKTLKCDKDGYSDLTLLINDVEEIQTAFGWTHVIWSSFLSLSLGLYLLASRLGWASVVPLILVCLTSQCGQYASKYFVGKYTAWNEATQVRMGLMKILLEHLKPIKMMGYSHAMETKIQAVRDNEIRAGLVTS